MSEPSKNREESWIKEFDEKFPVDFEDDGEDFVGRGEIFEPDREELKSFISQVRSQAIAETLNEILAVSESMSDIKVFRHLLKEKILKDFPSQEDNKKTQ